MTALELGFLKSITDNYSVLLELWDGSFVRCKDTEMKARIQGVASQMQRFGILFWCVSGLLNP